MFFPRHLPFNFQMLRMANHIATGGCELSHLMRVAGEIPEPSPTGWLNAWSRIAEEERRNGELCAARGAYKSAREYLLRACNYARVSTFYLSAEHPAKRASNTSSRAAFAAAQPHADHFILNTSVAWRQGALPGYLLLPRQASYAPAVVFIGGADASKEELYFTGGRRLVEQGFAVLLLDGPGQGEAWLAKGFGAAPDWDTLGPSIFDTLAAFPSIDLENVGLLGISMGGYYAPKIASAEPRFKCLAVWGACFDVLEDLYDFYPTIQSHLREIAGVDEASARAFYAPFHLREATKQITCDVLVTHGAEDRVVSRQSAEKFAAALGARGELRMYSGGSHCMYNMPTVSQPPMFDWLADKLNTVPVNADEEFAQ